MRKKTATAKSNSKKTKSNNSKSRNSKSVNYRDSHNLGRRKSAESVVTYSLDSRLFFDVYAKYNDSNTTKSDCKMNDSISTSHENVESKSKKHKLSNSDESQSTEPKKRKESVTDEPQHVSSKSETFQKLMTSKTVFKKHLSKALPVDKSTPKSNKSNITTDLVLSKRVLRNSTGSSWNQMKIDYSSDSNETSDSKQTDSDSSVNQKSVVKKNGKLSKLSVGKKDVKIKSKPKKITKRKVQTKKAVIKSKKIEPIVEEIRTKRVASLNAAAIISCVHENIRDSPQKKVHSNSNNTDSKDNLCVEITKDALDDSLTDACMCSPDKVIEKINTTPKSTSNKSNKQIPKSNSKAKKVAFIENSIVKPEKNIENKIKSKIEKPIKTKEKLEKPTETLVKMKEKIDKPEIVNNKVSILPKIKTIKKVTNNSEVTKENPKKAITIKPKEKPKIESIPETNSNEESTPKSDSLFFDITAKSMNKSKSLLLDESKRVNNSTNNSSINTIKKTETVKLNGSVTSNGNKTVKPTKKKWKKIFGNESDDQNEAIVEEDSMGTLWNWVGEGKMRKIQLKSKGPLVEKLCYQSIKHTKDDLVIAVNNCVLLKSDDDSDPFIGKISDFYHDSAEDKKMMVMYWYYRPENTNIGRQDWHGDDDLYASRHLDINGIECIEDLAYVLPIELYGRFAAFQKRQHTTTRPSLINRLVPSIPTPSDDDNARNKDLVNNSNSNFLRPLTIHTTNTLQHPISETAANLAISDFYTKQSSNAVTNAHSSSVSCMFPSEVLNSTNVFVCRGFYDIFTNQLTHKLPKSAWDENNVSVNTAATPNRRQQPGTGCSPNEISPNSCRSDTTSPQKLTDTSSDNIPSLKAVTAMKSENTVRPQKPQETNPPSIQVNPPSKMIDVLMTSLNNDMSDDRPDRTDSPMSISSDIEDQTPLNNATITTAATTIMPHIIPVSTIIPTVNCIAPNTPIILPPPPPPPPDNPPPKIPSPPPLPITTSTANCVPNSHSDESAHIPTKKETEEILEHSSSIQNGDDDKNNKDNCATVESKQTDCKPLV